MLPMNSRASFEGSLDDLIENWTADLKNLNHNEKLGELDFNTIIDLIETVHNVKCDRPSSNIKEYAISYCLMNKLDTIFTIEAKEKKFYI